MSAGFPLRLSLFDVARLWAKGKQYALEGLPVKIRCSGWNDTCHSGSQLTNRLSLQPLCHSGPGRAIPRVPASWRTGDIWQVHTAYLSCPPTVWLFGLKTIHQNSSVDINYYVSLSASKQLHVNYSPD